MALTKKKEPWHKFLLKAGITLGLLLLTLEGVTSTFRYGKDTQTELCLDPYSRYLVNIRMRSVTTGDFVAYTAKGLEPHIKDGETLIKIVSGVAGDYVEVRSDGGTYVNGEIVRQGLVLSDKLGKPQQEFVRAFVVPKGEVFLTAWHPRAYDGRYWGTVNTNQIVGKAWMLW